MKKKILILYPSYFVGGSTTSLISLLNTIDADKYDIYLGIKDSGKPFINKIPQNITIIPNLSKMNKNSFLSKTKFIIKYLFKGYLFKALFAEFKRSKKIKPNIQMMSKFAALESKDMKMDFDVAIGYFEYWANDYLVMKVKSKRKIAWIHTDYIEAKFLPKHDKEKFDKVDYIVSVSFDCKNNIDKIFPELKEKSIVIENIVSSKNIIEKSQYDNNDHLYNYDGFKLLTVARIDIFTKGLDRIVNTVRQIKEKKLNIKWYIIGGGPDYKGLLRMINGNNLSDNLVLLGEKANPFPYIKKCDLFILPSRFEGKPIVVTEAQILKKPVLVTKYNSALNQVDNYRTGIIVDNNDNSLFNEIVRLYHNRNVLTKIISNLEKIDYGNENEVKRLEALF